MKTKVSSVLCALVFAALLTTGCDSANKKLSVLDGTTFVGDAPPTRIMGALMYGHYQLSFSKNEKGRIQCFLTTTIHDGQYGWGQPAVEEIKNLIFREGVDSYGVKGFDFCSDRIIKTTDIRAVQSGQAPDKMTIFNEQSDEITLKRSK